MRGDHMKRILICYYTETFSTKEVCDNIADTLGTENEVTIKELKEVDNLSNFDTIVIAAPIHGMRWHQSANDFVLTHKQVLKDKEIVYIALASMAYQGYHFWQKKIYNALEKPSKIVKPIETAVFGGLSGDMPSFFSLIFGVPKDAKADQRDWNMIKEWNINLLKQIKKS
jgi:menaquinone-dependent protoporphyrinogen IX oxidase